MEKLKQSVVRAGFMLILCHAMPACACTFSQMLDVTIPLNTVDIGNAARVEVAQMVIRARDWRSVTGVDIKAEIISPALASEHRAASLANARGKMIKAYLMQLGLKEENIFYDPQVLQERRGETPEQYEHFRRTTIGLLPVCEGGCDRLCHDPAIAPDSRGRE
ncbi:hypothetical protein [Caballeronia catudaia]|uniref:hypothetical protein n=1 Tax=Caballeronia catudaia TaxID=1777136 RepID=UPI0007722650|nr:hypothetical protein [Caballeronia catudaia]